MSPKFELRTVLLIIACGFSIVRKQLLPSISDFIKRKDKKYIYKSSRNDRSLKTNRNIRNEFRQFFSERQKGESRERCETCGIKDTAVKEKSYLYHVIRSILALQTNRNLTLTKGHKYINIFFIVSLNEGV